MPGPGQKHELLGGAQAHGGLPDQAVFVGGGVRRWDKGRTQGWSPTRGRLRCSRRSAHSACVNAFNFLIERWERGGGETKTVLMSICTVFEMEKVMGGGEGSFAWGCGDLKGSV